jgi:hypothetical protein
MADHDALDPWLRSLLRCPRCLSELADAVDPDGRAELWCAGERDPDCRLEFRVADGIPMLLVDEARRPADADPIQ